MPPRKKGKRHRSQERLTLVQPNTHSVALATIRDATVAFGAGYGALRVPVERRIVQYLRQQRLFVVGGCNSGYGASRTCYSLDAVGGGGPDDWRATWLWSLCASGPWGVETKARRVRCAHSDPAHALTWPGLRT